MVAPPPLLAYLLILFLIWAAVSESKIELFGSELDILLFLPYRAGKKDEYKEAGFSYFSLCEMSLVILK